VTGEFDPAKDSMFPDNPFICRTPSNAVIDMQGLTPDSRMIYFYEAAQNDTASNSNYSGQSNPERGFWHFYYSLATDLLASPLLRNTALKIQSIFLSKPP